MDVYVGNLDAKCDDVELRNAFEQFGPVKNIKIMPIRPIGMGMPFDIRNSKYGFVSFYDPGDAENAVKHGKVTPIMLNGNPLKVNWASRPCSYTSSFPEDLPPTPPVIRIPGGAPLCSPKLGGRGKKVKPKKNIVQEELNRKWSDLEKEEQMCKLKRMKSRVEYLQKRISELQDERDVFMTLNVDDNFSQIAVLRSALIKRREEPNTYKNSKTVEKLEFELSVIAPLLKESSKNETFEKVQKKVKLFEEYQAVAKDQTESDVTSLKLRVMRGAAEELVEPLRSFLSKIPYTEFWRKQLRLETYLKELQKKCPSLKDATLIEVDLQAPFEKFDLSAMSAAINKSVADDLYTELCQATSQVMGFLTTPWDEKMEVPEIADLTFRVKNAMEDELKERQDRKVSRLEASHVSLIFGKLLWCQHQMKEQMSEYSYIYNIAKSFDQDYSLSITKNLWDPDQSPPEPEQSFQEDIDSDVETEKEPDYSLLADNDLEDDTTEEEELSNINFDDGEEEEEVEDSVSESNLK